MAILRAGPGLSRGPGPDHQGRPDKPSPEASGQTRWKTDDILMGTYCLVEMKLYFHTRVEAVPIKAGNNTTHTVKNTLVKNAHFDKKT